MALDLIAVESKEVTDRLHGLGFRDVFAEKDGVLSRLDDENPFEINAYSGDDYEFVIQKGKADAVADMEKKGFLLNKGLCHKMKENRMFVIFKFSNLIESENFFKTYKNLQELIPGFT